MMHSAERGYLRKWMRRCVAGHAVALFGFAAAVQGTEPSLTAPRLEWTFTTPGSGLGDSGLRFFDIDGDGIQEILVGDREDQWHVIELGQDLLPAWSSLPFEEHLIGLEPVATPSGAIVVIRVASALVIVDGLTRNELWRFPIDAGVSGDLSVADLDGDGELEALVCDEENLYRFDLKVGTLTGIKYGFSCDDMDVGQVDEDPQLEVAIGGNPFGGFILDGVTLDVEWASLDGFGFDFQLADLDGDGLGEIVGFDDGWGEVRALDPRTGAELWRIEGETFQAVQVAELSPLPGLEVILGIYNSGGLRIVSGLDGQTLWEVENSSLGVSRIEAGDLDGNDQPEIAWVAGSGYGGGNGRTLYVSMGTGTSPSYQSRRFFGPLPSHAVGDFSGTGKVEIAAADRGSLTVLDFASGRLDRYTGPYDLGPSNTITGLAAAQLDSDDQLEVCIAVEAYISGGWTRCYDGAMLTPEWTVALSKAPEFLLAAELDGDPWTELVAPTQGGLVLAQEGESGWLKWQSPDPPDGIFRYDETVAVDLDSDGQLEIVAALLDHAGPASYASDSGELLAGPFDLAFSSIATRADLSGVAVDVVAGFPDGSVRVIDALTGALGERLAQLPFAILDFAIYDVTRDGEDDILVFGNGKLHLFDGALGAVTWASPFLGQYGNPRAGISVGNFDQDSVPDILVSTFSGLFRFSGPLLDLFHDGFESGGIDAWTSSVP